MVAPSSALSPGRLATPGPLGTVDTVAGPGYCDGPATPDPATTEVGDVAVDPTGTVWFESGPIGAGVFTKVSDTASVDVMRPGIATQGGDEGGTRLASVAASASRLAADGKGGLLVATPTAVMHFDVGLAAVAGTTSVGGKVEARAGAGDGGPLGAARFTRVAAIASDSAGNVYVVDEIDERSSENTIRFLNRSENQVTFYAGSEREITVAAGAVATIAGGTAQGTRLSGAASALAVAGQRLYLGATLPGRRGAVVQVLNLGDRDLSAHGATVMPGATATVATVESAGRTDGATTGATVPALSGLAADSEGQLFLAEPANHRVRRIDAAGVATTVAGTGAPGFNGNERPATQARLDRPHDVEVGPTGRLYISDAGNRQIRLIDQAGTIRVALGNGAATGWVCAAPASSASSITSSRPAIPGSPVSLAGDADGNLYVVTSTLRQVHRLTPSGVLAPIAGRAEGFCGDPGGCPAADDVPPTEAGLAQLAGVGGSPVGGLYLVEATRIRFLNLHGRPLTVHGVAVAPGAMRTVAGKAPSDSAASDSTSPPVLPPSTPDDERAVGATAGGLAVAGDHKGNLFIGDIPVGRAFGGNGSVLQVDSRGVITTLVARPGPAPGGTTDPSRCCSFPADLVADEAGNLYIADTLGSRVWFLNRSAATVSVHGVLVLPGTLEVVAGAGPEGSQDEGVPAREAKLSRPAGLTLDRSGNLYFVDVTEHAVHRVDPEGTIVTVAGSGQPGFNGDGLKGQLTALREPRDVAIDRCGNLLIADSGNHRVRRLNLVTSCPARGTSPSPSNGGGAAAAGLLAGTTLVGGTLALRRRRVAQRRCEAGSHGQ
jgi:sugar lactone lactonase YvrE